MPVTRTRKPEQSALTLRSRRSADLSANNAGVPSSGQLIDNRFRIESVLGAGVHAVVFSATNLVTGGQAALKWPRDVEASSRLLHEARMASAVCHPYVVDIYDVGEHQDVLYLLMALVPGESMHVLTSRGVLSLTSVCSLLMKVVDAVIALSSAGIVHGDLKPANLVIARRNGQWWPTLVDFGSARAVGQDSSSGQARATDDAVALLSLAAKLADSPGIDAPEPARRALRRLSELQAVLSQDRPVVLLEVIRTRLAAILASLSEYELGRSERSRSW